MGKGQKLYSKAKQIVAGGNMLLSKRPEMFLPEHWPAYFTKTRGCEVWDLDGNKYIDTLMMPGTNSLGYSHPEVDEAVKETVGNGNMSSLNAPEEVELTERLVELHPWADMARFARSGGEANSVAIRLSRAASGRDNVAFCGYHGWHDWYLASNLSDSKGLDGHLLPGLDPHGVPQNLKGSVYPFEYNNFDKLENLVKTKNIGVIKMEVYRNKEPENNFLQRVRKLANDNNIVLVFDLPVTTALERVHGHREADEFEKEDHLEKVRAAYLNLKDDPIVKIVDATRKSEEIFQEVWMLVSEVMNE